MFSLVRPPLNAFALGLSLVFSELCIPFAISCLCSPLLYSEGLVVWQDHTNCVHDVSARSSIVKTSEVVRERLCRRLTCAWEGLEAVHGGVTRPGTQPL